MGELKPNRRDFITKIMPACSLLCFGGNLLPGENSPITGTAFLQDKHKFHREMANKLTFKQLYDYRFKRKFIPILKAMADEMGKEELLEILKKASYADNKRNGERFAQRTGKNDLSTLINPFRQRRGMVLRDTLVYEIVEDTEKAFEIRATECLDAVVFKEANAADIGYAAICHADYGMQQGFNPKIKLVRDKTLMQGHDCCNHRYVWTG